VQPEHRDQVSLSLPPSLCLTGVCLFLQDLLRMNTLSHIILGHSCPSRVHGPNPLVRNVGRFALTSSPLSPSSASTTQSHCLHPLAPAPGGAVVAVVAPQKECLEAGVRVHKFSKVSGLVHLL
jgi:hypothetical protein